MDGDREEDGEVARFTTRPATLREMIWAQKLVRPEGDPEALGNLLEARRLDPNWDVLDLSGDELSAAVKEMADALANAGVVDALLQTVTIK